MDAIRKGHRVEVCRTCRRKWNVSKVLKIEPGMYECPVCESKRRDREKRR